MNDVTIKMLEIYKPLSNLDWLNYKIKDQEDLTFHHIQKKVDNGRQDIQNGAILTRTAHKYLHLIEYIDLYTYLKLNEVFIEVNNQEKEPDLLQRKKIEYILQDFEKENRYYKEKGKLLVKHKYLKRWY